MTSCVRPLALALIFALAGWSAPAAAELPHHEILEVISGTWELDPAETPDAERETRCDLNPVQIRISEGETGRVYESVYVGRPETARRSPIRSYPFAMHIKYENEARTTPAGALVEWLLIMPDADHYYWVRTDWVGSQPGGRTALFRRCPAAIA